MESHPKWRNPPLREAVFELRFPQTPDYSIFVGGLAAAIKDRYPDVLPLPGVNLPANLGGIVRHRFVSSDKFTFIQTGVDVASINFIAYPGFESSLQEIEFLVKTLQEFIDLNTKTRLGLRYLNQFESVKDPFQTINMAPPFTDFNAEHTERLRINHIKRDNFPLMVSINIEFPLNQNRNEMLLDLDVYQFIFEERSDEADIPGSLLSWAERAHNLIWSNFDAIVAQQEKDKRV
jgi:uncharacterized protein (TIGR04255 family)